MKKKVIDNKTIRERSIKLLIESLVDLVADKFPMVEKNILENVLVKNKTFAELSVNNGLTINRQRIILKNSVIFLNKVLKATSAKLHECDAIQNELEELRELKKFYESQIVRRKEIPPELLKLLTTPISNTRLSSRVKGVCIGGKIGTLLDLVRLNPADFIKLRNCGKKTRIEVDEYFQEHGLKWNMDV